MVTREWFLRRNCSISPRQLAMFYVGLSVVSLTIALFFTLRGAWMILAFAVLEMSAVGLAFLIYARHVLDHEHISLTDDVLLVELVQAGRTQQFRFNPHWARVAVPVSRHDLVAVEAHGVRIEVGRCLTERGRREFAQELEKELARAGVR